MNSKFGFSIETEKLLLEAFHNFKSVQKVKIFGSRALGNYSAGSDIDIVVYAPTITHDEFLKLQIALEDLELLYEIDCLNYDKITEPALKEHIDHFAKTFYPGEVDSED